MEKFLCQFSTLPKKFIKDFFIIAKEEYNDTECVIDFDAMCAWLNVRKDHLKEILVKHFEKDYDYVIESKKKKQQNSTGLTTYNEILITPNCFKELCMISQSAKAKEVRKYFIEMERLIKRYNNDIKETMYRCIGLLEKNQKPKVDVKGGVLYILEAQNTDVTLYKLGKTNDLSNRLRTYNSGNANDVEPIFIIKVDDIDAIEDCVKQACRKFQYRKYKEVYEIDLDVLKEAIEKCEALTNSMTKHYANYKRKKEFANKIKRMKTNDNGYFAFVSRDE